MKKISMLFAVSLITISALQAQNWSLDKAHSRLGFGITHMMISEVNGNFKTFDVKFTSAKDDFSDATVEMTAESASINTELEMRDKDLRSAGWFNTEANPSVTFKSTSFKKTGDKKFTMTGDLTMKGVTKSVTLDVTLIGTMTRQRDQKLVAGFKVGGVIKRSDFGIGGNPSSVSDEVNLMANLEIIKG